MTRRSDLVPPPVATIVGLVFWYLTPSWAREWWRAWGARG